jgi:uncharacterized membrane protein
VRRALWMAAVLVAPACAHWTELDEVSCPPGGTTLRYRDAAGFMAAYCNRCHSAPEGERSGAPLGVVVDNYASVYNLRERIFLRAAADNTTRPPGPDDPPAAERAQLAEWIACGAPER